MDKNVSIKNAIRDLQDWGLMIEDYMQNGNITEENAKTIFRLRKESNRMGLTEREEYIFMYGAIHGLSMAHSHVLMKACDSIDEMIKEVKRLEEIKRNKYKDVV